MTRDRILLIIEGLNSGGAERQLCGLASLLTWRGYDCRLLYYNDEHFYESYLIRNGVEYEYRPDLLRKFSRIFRLVKYIREYKPTVVIAYLPMVNKACCLVRLMENFKLIVSERNNKASVTFRDKFLYNLYRVADYVVPNSICQGEFIRQNFPFLSAKVYPIINFVDESFFAPPLNKRNNNVFRIITVARYSSQKNCINFLECVAKLKTIQVNVRFDWFGSKSYDSNYYRFVEAKAKELDILDCLSLNDASEDILAEYQKADAFLLPSIYEGYPNVIAEAMCCELPILCSRVYENPYIVEENINGFLFDPNNIDEMVLAIKKLLGLSIEQREEMGKRNRRICIERNAKDAFVQKYIDLLTKFD